MPRVTPAKAPAGLPSRLIPKSRGSLCFPPSLGRILGRFCQEGSGDLHNFTFHKSQQIPPPPLPSPETSVPVLSLPNFCFVPTKLPGCCTRSWSLQSIPRKKQIGNSGVRPRPTSPTQAPRTDLGSDFWLLLFI